MVISRMVPGKTNGVSYSSFTGVRALFLEHRLLDRQDSYKA